ATGVVLAAAEALVCTVGAVASSNQATFAVPVLMPASAGSGNFVLVAAPPGGFGDGVPANNSVTLPWSVAPPFADLALTKSKSPSSGPVAVGTTITSTLTVTNAAGSTSAASWTASGGAGPLRVVDYLRPAEIAGDLVTGVTAGWTCTVSNNADPQDVTRSKRVLCISDSAGSLAIGASTAVSFSTTVGVTVGQVTLSNRACTGETVLTHLGLTPADGPQPPESGLTANDCQVRGGNLIATDVVSGLAAVTVRKESSINGTDWFDPVGSAPTLAGSATTQFWRIILTTPSALPQAIIPTLNVSDTLPGILNVTSPGAPAPSYVTPAISVSHTVDAGSAGGSCSNVAAGSSNLSCSFSSVAPGTTITISYQVARPVVSGLLTNTATLSSPDAILTGTLSDAAAIQVTPQLDLAMTSKNVAPATPRVGQAVLFTLTAQNLGPDEVAAVGDFKIIDDFNTSIAGGSVAFADIVPSGSLMSCAVANSALADEPALAANHSRVRCTNTNPVARYATRTVSVAARIAKPGSLPPSGNVFPGQVNTARVDLADTRCEFKIETVTNAGVSASCNDAPSTSNNTQSVTFDVQVPQIDLQQRKERRVPVGQSSFGVGQPLRYFFRLQNNAQSRAEGVVMTDQLTVPAGFTLASPTLLNVNAAAAEAGFTLDATKTATVSCSQAAANADLVCQLSSTPADNFLDPAREVNFEVEFVQTGTSVIPVSFRNEALACADETLGYELSGACNRVLPNNNVASVNDTVFPRTDLSVAKTTVSASPVTINQLVEYQLVVRNLGPSATQRLVVTDTLPPGFELVTGGANTPSVTPGAFVTAAPSTATGADIACTASPVALVTANQVQTVTCTLNATPGPLGAGAFPGSADAANTLTVRLRARPRDGFFTGPYNTNRTNTAVVSTGNDALGNPLSIDTVAGNNSSTSEVQVAQGASLSGRVFNDRNGNGAQNGTSLATDGGIGTVVITLTGTDNQGNAVSRTVSTDNSLTATRGDFLFEHLPPGTYTVTETQPAGFVDSAGTPAAASAGGSYAAAPAVGTSAWSGVTLAIGTVATGYLFPESLPPTTVSGRVFLDRNDDAVFGGGDSGISGVTLGLYVAGTVCPASGPLPGGALQTQTTAGDGTYTFSNVTSGNDLVVCQQQPAGYGDRNPQPGTAGSTPRANQIDIASLPLGGSANNNFREVLGAISGLVFLDFNVATPGSTNNGSQQAGEPGLGSATPGLGVPITLTGTPSAGPGAGVAITPITVTTAADGSWQFTDLFPGTYTATQGAIPVSLGLYAEGINTAGTVSSGTAGNAGNVGDSAVRDIVLGAGGATSTGNRFAELPRASITGLVYIDRNRDNTLTGADPGRLSGVTIQLRTGGSTCADGTLVGTTVTGADGGWGFPGGNVTEVQVAAGVSYIVCQVQPSAYANGATEPAAGASSPSANQINVPSLPNTGSNGHRFGEWAGSLAGSVYRDFGSTLGGQPNNGQRDAGELGIRDVPITLRDGSNAVVATVTTDLSGNYRFDDLPMGTYSLTEGQIPPASGLFSNGRLTLGRIGGTPVGVLGNDVISSIAMPAGGQGINYDFGELPPDEGPLSFIAGMVYIDRNRDGALQAGETGRLGGVTLRLVQGTSCTGTVLGTTVSDGNGLYAFPGGTVGENVVRAGRVYSVCQDQPAGHGNGGTNPGAGNTTPARDHIVVNALSPLGSRDNNFGEHGGRIAGQVYLDRDNNGAVGATDNGLAGVRVTLTGNALAGPRQVITDAEGRFAFEDLPAGTYSLAEQEEQPVVTEAGKAVTTIDGRTTAGTGGGTASAVGSLPSTISGITLPAGGEVLNNLFGEGLGGAICGRVWKDNDDDGVVDAGEPGLAGVSLVLTGSDDLGRSISANASTGPDGSYCFTGLRPGSYTVTEPQQPEGTFSGLTVPGSAGGTATGVATTPSAITGIVLQPGVTSVDNNFGEAGGPGAISGRVWLDRNNDGVVDPGEPGLGNVTVVLTGVDSRGQPVSLSTVTTADGRWRFDNLRPGTYTVTEPEQPPGTQDGRTLPGTSGGVATPAGQPSAIRDIPLISGVESTQNLFGETNPAPDLRVIKTARESRFLVGRVGTYVIEVRNAGGAPTVGAYTVTDRLPAGLSLQATPTATGWACTGAPGAASFSCTSSVVLAGLAAHPSAIEARVQVAEAAAAASPASNAVMVEGGGEPPESGPTPQERDTFTRRPDELPLCTPAATAACRSVTEVQRTASLSGSVWLDQSGQPRQRDPGDPGLAGWTVELIDARNGSLVATQLTQADGGYRFVGLEPGVPFIVRFREPGSGVVYGMPVNGEQGQPAAPCSPSGVPSSCAERQQGPQLSVILAPGEELRQQSLPVDPSGVVYDSAARTPLPGSVVSLTPVGSCPGWNPAAHVAGAQAGGYTIVGNSISMTTGASGFYQFVLLPSAPARCLFGIGVTPPPSHTFVSVDIPPQPQPLVPTGPVGTVVRVQPQPEAPSGDPGPATVYHLQVEVGSGTPEVVHNHIPVDPRVPAALALRKTGDRSVADIGDTVRYSVTVRLTQGAAPRQLTVVDRLPAGFTYIPGTAFADGRRLADPLGQPGPTLAFQLGAMPPSGSITLQYRVRVGVGAAQGDGINRAVAHGCAQGGLCVQPGTWLPLPRASSTQEDRFRVRVGGAAVAAESCVVGKVFVDCNGNHVQDAEELGIPGVRLVLQDGTFLTSDSEGKYSMCRLPARSHVLRVDESTLPRGSRLTTSSNRNLGDAGSLWLDLRRGDLQRADFVEGSCSNTVLDQVKARRALGEHGQPQVEKAGRPALRFDSKAHGRNALTTPAQGTDSANQLLPGMRPAAAASGAASGAAWSDERNLSTDHLPMNRPPPPGRRTSDPPNPAVQPAQGGQHGSR
ncbi:MAG: hypothetical protein RJA10_546, partial [Pseudomonadota bacterium]